MRTIAFALGAFFLAGSVTAQDPTKVASEQYKIMFENDSVRVLKITYEPGAESAMHSHPDAVGVFLSDGKFSFTLPDGTTDERAGEARGATPGD